MPRVSIVIPTHNSAQYIAQTLESIQQQEFRDWEVLIIDDGSTDDTAETIEPFLSDRIRYQAIERFGGPSKPRNVGVRDSQGEFVALFDSDDLMLPGKLSRSVELLGRCPELGLAFTDFQAMTDAGEPTPGRYLDRYDRFHQLRKQPVDDVSSVIAPEVAYEGLFFAHFIGTSSAMIRRSTLEQVGPFDESLTNGDDRDMWFRIAQRYSVGYVDIPGHYYRVRGTSITGRGFQLAFNRIAVLRKQLSEGPMTPVIRRRIRQRIAENLNGIGFHYQRSGELKSSRAYYSQSLRERWSVPATRGILISFLGSRNLATLKRLLGKQA